MSTRVYGFTPGQEKVLRTIAQPNPVNPNEQRLWNAHEIADELERGESAIFSRIWTYDRVHGILVRLAKRGEVVRLPNRSVADDWRLP